MVREIKPNNRGFTLILRERNEGSLEFIVRAFEGDPLPEGIVRGRRCWVLGDHDNPTPNMKIFEGLMIDRNERGTWNKRIHVLAREFFKDRLLTRIHNAKHQLRKAGQIFKDIVADAGSEFTTNGVQDTSVTISEDFPQFLCELAADTLAEDTLTEYYCKPNLDVVFRPVQSEDSGITITESMVKDMTEVKRSLGESISEAIVIGGLDEDGQRVIARAIDDTLPENIRGRKRSLHDQRYTTYQGAKLKALSMLAELGKDFINIPPIEVKDLPSLPRPGTLVTCNMPSHELNNVKIVVKQIQIDVRAGEESVQWIKIWLGESEKILEERIMVQQALFERERARGTLHAQIATQQLLNARNKLELVDIGAGVEACSTFQLDEADPGNCEFGLDGGSGHSQLDA